MRAKPAKMKTQTHVSMQNPVFTLTASCALGNVSTEGRNKKILKPLQSEAEVYKKISSHQANLHEDP
jgi:hypothetical protein